MREISQENARFSAIRRIPHPDPLPEGEGKDRSKPPSPEPSPPEAGEGRSSRGPQVAALHCNNNIPHPDPLPRGEGVNGGWVTFSVFFSQPRAAGPHREDERPPHPDPLPLKRERGEAAAAHRWPRTMCNDGGVSQ